MDKKNEKNKKLAAIVKENNINELDLYEYTWTQNAGWLWYGFLCIHQSVSKPASPLAFLHGYRTLPLTAIPKRSTRSNACLIETILFFHHRLFVITLLVFFLCCVFVIVVAAVFCVRCSHRLCMLFKPKSDHIFFFLLTFSKAKIAFLLP